MKTPEEKETAVTGDKAVPKKTRPSNVFFGVLASISPTELVIKGKAGKELAMKLHEKIKSTCDGVACKCNELTAGRKVRVVTQKSDLTIAIRIASLDKEPRFAPLA